MDKKISERKNSIIQRHKELFNNISLEERQEAFNKAVQFSKEVGDMNFDEIKTEAILKK